MKLTIIGHFPINRYVKFLFLFVILFGADRLSAQISVDYKDVKLSELLWRLEEDTDYNFVYKSRDVSDQLVSVKSEDEPIEEVLNKALKDTELEYRLDKKFIHIKKFKQTPEKKKATPKKKKDEEVLVKGKVTNAKGEPVSFASIQVKGAGTGCMADIDGNYQIKLKSVADAVLLVTSVGFEPSEEKVAGRELLDFILKENLVGLEEVVVTGYQVIDKRKLSSSVTTIQAKDLQETGATSIDNMLQGKVSGLAVMSSSSTPGAAPKIRIRGSSSISGNREPVWVVDGVILDDPVPLSAAELNSLDQVNLIGNAISSINPEDIARIDVLKDASATAIYGVKAANGVIVITTKDGKKGKARVKYVSNFSISTRPYYNNLNLMNSKERIQVSQEIYQRGLKFPTDVPRVGYEGALYDLFDKNITPEEFGLRVKQLQEQNTDWFDILYRNAFTQKHTLTLSGADDKTNYYFSGGYTDSDASVVGSGMKQYNALMKLNHKVNSRLDLKFQLRGSQVDKTYLHSSIDPYKYAYNTSRAIPVRDANGDLVYYNTSGTSDYLYNVLNERDNSGRSIETGSINLNMGADLKITSWLKYNGLASLSKSNTEEIEWIGEDTYWVSKQRYANLSDWDPSDKDLMDKSKLPYGGQYKSSNTKQISYTIRNSLRANKSFGKHGLTGVLGTEARSLQYDGLASVQRGYLPERGKKFVAIDPIQFPKYKEWLLENPDVVTDRKNNFLSFYGVATYDYDARYSLNFNMRADGSNNFGQDDANKFLPVWSVSGRWNVHNERFLDLDWLNVLALRASYGIQGNVHPDQTPNLIIKQGSLNSTSGQYTSNLFKLPNPKLNWEKTESYNFGLDYNLFKGRISGNLELYKKIGTDQVIYKEVSTVTGVSKVSINGGNLENRGWEFSIRGDIVRSNDWDLSLSFNAFKNTNEVTQSGVKSEYTYSDYLNGNVIVEGRPIDGFYSYKFAGLDENGYPTFKDIEETDGITKAEMFEKIFHYSGERTPDFNGGFSTFLRYKSFRLSMNFAYSVGAKIRLNSLYSSSGQRLPMPHQNMSAEFVDRWRKSGDENLTHIPVLSDQSLKLDYDEEREIRIGDNMWEMYNKSDLRVVSGSFLRLRNVALRYNMPKEFSQRLKVQEFTLKCEGSNLYLWADKDLNGQDPEHVSFGSNTTPITPSFSLGLEILF